MYNIFVIKIIINMKIFNYYIITSNKYLIITIVMVLNSIVKTRLNETKWRVGGVYLRILMLFVYQRYFNFDFILSLIIYI